MDTSSLVSLPQGWLDHWNGCFQGCSGGSVSLNAADLQHTEQGWKIPAYGCIQITLKALLRRGAGFHLLSCTPVSSLLP